MNYIQINSLKSIYNILLTRRVCLRTCRVDALHGSCHLSIELVTQTFLGVKITFYSADILRTHAFFIQVHFQLFLKDLLHFLAYSNSC